MNLERTRNEPTEACASLLESLNPYQEREKFCDFVIATKLRALLKNLRQKQQLRAVLQERFSLLILIPQNP
jgi:hypothetical protein